MAFNLTLNHHFKYVCFTTKDLMIHQYHRVTVLSIHNVFVKLFIPSPNHLLFLVSMTTLCGCCFSGCCLGPPTCSSSTIHRILQNNRKITKQCHLHRTIQRRRKLLRTLGSANSRVVGNRKVSFRKLLFFDLLNLVVALIVTD